MDEQGLPSFERPPVVETVLGVQFQPLPALRNAHLGAFWKSLGDDWPVVLDAPTLEPVFERFEKGGSWGALGPHLTLTSNPSSRLQIRNKTNDEMIQVQNGRLHFNWLGHKGLEYPRYNVVRPRFDDVLQRFKQFIGEHQLGDLLPNQWEITYVNHIPQVDPWRSPEDISRIFSGLPVIKAAPAGLKFETFTGEWHFVIEPQRGRLHIDAGFVRSGPPPGQEVLRLTLTARGPANNDSELRDGLNLGRQTIVRTFVELASVDAKKYWGLHE
jgi:uncharacterized protein (TIGR04255 family)